ncbi:MAG: PilZ domain-containing protein [Terriglobales bacterium]
MTRNDDLAPRVASQGTQARTVLCIDDDESLLRTLCLYLQAYGYNTLAESGGWPAIEAIIQARPLYAIVMDYAMPQISAADLCTNLRLTQPDLPIVLFSGMIDQVPGWILRIVDTHVRKNDGFDALVATLNRLPRLKKKPLPVRRFPRYPVELPIEVTIGRPEGQVTVRGVITNLGEGGFGGKFADEMRPGEMVCITIGEPQLRSLQPRAKLRSRYDDIYGFEFLNLDSHEQSAIRNCCERLAGGERRLGADTSAWP